MAFTAQDHADAGVLFKHSARSSVHSSCQEPGARSLGSAALPKMHLGKGRPQLVEVGAGNVCQLAGAAVAVPVASTQKLCQVQADRAYGIWDQYGTRSQQVDAKAVGTIWALDEQKHGLEQHKFMLRVP